ncbi:MAG: nitrilase-related carbon-nitrogen hydrolase [Dialister sp.]|nr:nitrilase-related carbon-nitrogen hydrolase [Dialister sp.]
MRIGLIQMDVSTGDKERNIEHAFGLLDQASRRAEVLVMPELWTIGYDFRNLENRVTTYGDRLFSRLSAFAAGNHITLEAGTLPIKKDGVIRNTALIFGPDGRLIASYSKRHLFYGYLEAELMKPGKELLQMNLQGVTTGMAVCYEFYYPRMWRRMAKAGTTLVLSCASWPLVHLSRWDVLTRARAIENGICIAACNMSGCYHGLKLGGHSRFIDPVGQVTSEAGTGEEIIYADYDKEKYKDLAKMMAVIQLEKQRRQLGE